MSIQIPLTYASVYVGMGLVDDELSDLPAGLIWRLEVPKTVRKLAVGRQDILVALLREDSFQLRRCHPYIWVGSRIPLRLTRVALRHELIPLVFERSSDLPDPESVLAGIREISATVHKVIFLDGNRVNCQTENLREVQ